MALVEAKEAIAKAEPPMTTDGLAADNYIECRVALRRNVNRRLIVVSLASGEPVLTTASTVSLC